MKINKFIKTGFNATQFFLMPTIRVLPLLPLCVLFNHMISEMGGLENIKYNFSPTVDLSYKINGDVHNNKYKSFFNSLLLDKGLLLNIGFTRKELNVNIGLYETTEIGEHYSFNKNYIELYLRDFENSKPPYDEFKKSSMQIGLFSIFQSNDKVLSYIFFHEFAHKIDAENGFSKSKVNILLSQINEEGVKYTEYFLKRVTTQSFESFADAFAIKMMSLRYNDIDFEQTRRLVAGLRNYEYEYTSSYNIGYGLVWNKNNPISNREEIIKYSKIVAMDNIIFEYSQRRQEMNNKLVDSFFSEEKMINTISKIKLYKEEFESFSMDYEQKLKRENIKEEKVSIKVSP